MINIDKLKVLMIPVIILKSFISSFCSVAFSIGGIFFFNLTLTALLKEKMDFTISQWFLNANIWLIEHLIFVLFIYFVVDLFFSVYKLREIQ